MPISKQVPASPNRSALNLEANESISVKRDEPTRSAVISPGFWVRHEAVESFPGDPPVIRDIAELRATFWPEDEAIDDFVTFVRQQRAADRDLDE